MEARGDEPGAFGVVAEQQAQPAAIEWFASVDGSPVGPLGTDELVSRIATGVLDWDAHLWREGYAAWKTVGDSDTIVRAVASSRGSLDESARADSTERTTTPQDPDDDAPTTASMDEAQTISTLEDSPTRVAYDETPTRMFSASAPPSAGLRPVARTQFASRPPSVTGSRPPGELSPVRSVKSASYAPGVLPAANAAAAQNYAMPEQHPAPIALPYEPPLQQHSFAASAQSLPIQGRGPASVVPTGAGYAGGEGSGLIDIRALASLAQSRQQPARPQASYAAEPRAYERMPSVQNQAEQGYAYGEAQNGSADPLASFGTNHGVAFAALDSIAPVSRSKRPKDATVPLAILTGASMIAAAAFAALYVTRSAPATSISPVSVAQPVAAATVAPSEPVAAPTSAAEPAAEPPSAPVEAAAAAPVEPTPEPPSAAAPVAPTEEEAAAPRGAKRTALRKQRALRAEAAPADEEAAEPEVQAKAEAKPPSVDDILLGDSDAKPEAPAEPAPSAAPAKPKPESTASRSIDDLLDNAVTEKKAAAPAASAQPEAPSKSDVLTAMRGIEGEVRACAASEATPVQGTANVLITVLGSSGKVTSAEVTGIQGPVGSCIAKVARKASFAPFSRERFSVSFPYRFK